MCLKKLKLLNNYHRISMKGELFMLGNFNEEAQFILLKSREEMGELNHPYVGTEHLLLSLLRNDEDISKKLDVYGVSYDSFKNELIRVVGKGSKKSEFFLYTPLLKKIIENSLLDAKDNNNGEVTPSHLLSALIEEGEGIAIRLLVGMDVDLADLYNEFAFKLVKKSKKRKKKLLIDEIGTDLVEKAKNGKIDPVIGRDKEINRVIEILCRRCKNNPILIGEAGVGKTAIVEALADLINNGDVPFCLQNKRIISMDMASVVAGTKYRGEFEERMQKIIKELEDDEDIILFIDEIHTLVGAGGAEGAIDASNILKPALARGSIKCIGATTTNEYKKFIVDDKALDRRFQSVIVSEPDVEGTINILKGIVSVYEGYHNVRISNDILKDIVELSNRYISNRFNPDKSIDILDEVCSMVSIKGNKKEKDIFKLKKELEDVKRLKKACVLDNVIDKAYSYVKKESMIESKINELELSCDNDGLVVDIVDVAKVINRKTNIPIYEILKDDVNNIKNMEDKMKELIVDQDDAIDSLVNITKKLRLGYSNHKVKSFLFVGPTGVGKTELAKVYSEFLMGEGNLIRLDMSEFSSDTSVNKIIGSAPGYVGYRDNNTILDKIKANPTAVILLDEIDKASPLVINLLYQMLDEGVIKDSCNNVVNLNNNVIIMTSNVGFEDKNLGFSKRNRKNIISSLGECFSKALINRIDNIIMFNSISEDGIRRVIGKRLDKLSNKYVGFSYSDKLVSDIIVESCYLEYGVRKIDRIIENKLEGIIIDRMLNNEDLYIDGLMENQGI